MRVPVWVDIYGLGPGSLYPEGVPPGTFHARASAVHGSAPNSSRYSEATKPNCHQARQSLSALCWRPRKPRRTLLVVMCRIPETPFLQPMTRQRRLLG